MNIKEFRVKGSLQELNRQFLHPLGLALLTSQDTYGCEELEGIRDDRDKPEGSVFGDGVLSTEKAEAVEEERHQKHFARIAKLGYDIQPVENPYKRVFKSELKGLTGAEDERCEEAYHSYDHWNACLDDATARTAALRYAERHGMLKEKE
jgi:hypothetical protein